VLEPGRSGTPSGLAEAIAEMKIARIDEHGVASHRSRDGWR
jgi:hypothetical protein